MAVTLSLMSWVLRRCGVCIRIDCLRCVLTSVNVDVLEEAGPCQAAAKVHRVGTFGVVGPDLYVAERLLSLFCTVGNGDWF